jgi:hypothetical protein
MYRRALSVVSARGAGSRARSSPSSGASANEGRSSACSASRPARYLNDVTPSFHAPGAKLDDIVLFVRDPAQWQQGEIR